MFFSSHNKKTFCYVMYIHSRTNLRWEILLQHPSDEILKVVCHQYYYDSKRILSWDCIMSHYSLSFSLHKAFCHKSHLATFPYSLWSHILTLLQNRYFIPVGNYFLSRFFNRDYPSGTNVNVFFVPAAIQPGQMPFFTNKKNRMASSRFRVCKPVLQIKKFIQNCNFKIKI